MLVLTRGEGERIIITHEQIKIEIAVCGYNNKRGANPQVKLGIIAPKEVTVHREEVQNRIDKENYLKKFLSKKERDEE